MKPHIFKRGGYWRARPATIWGTAPADLAAIYFCSRLNGWE